MPAAREISATEHLRKIPAGVRPAVQAAPRTVQAVAPQPSEISYQGQPPRSSRTMWKSARYPVDGAQLECPLHDPSDGRAVRLGARE